MSDKLRIVFPLFENVDTLDFAGPLEVFYRTPNSQCELVTVKGGSITTDNGVVVAETKSVSDASDCSVLCVPGGAGHIQAMEDTAYLKAIRRLAEGADYVTGVCTGSLLLGAASLLQGKRAACHWAWRDFLKAFGAIPDGRRVVEDGRFITSGGVTAGIDMALLAISKIAGEQIAKRVQLGIEYAPEPIFDCGTPETADPETLAALQRRFEPIRKERALVIERASRIDWQKMGSE